MSIRPFREEHPLHAFQFALPTMATIALATALLAPVRKRRGMERSWGTSGHVPLAVNFSLDARATVSARAARKPPVAGAPQDRLRRRIRSETSRLAATLRRAFTQPPFRMRTESPDSPSPSFEASLADATLRLNGPALARSGVVSGDVVAPPDSPPSIVTAPDLSTLCKSSEPENVVSTFDIVAQPMQGSVIALSTGFDRIVPITRLPLRAEARVVTWFAGAGSDEALATRADRHAFLAHLCVAGDASHVALLAAAYREEDAEGRVLAMRALMRAGPAHGREIFAEALRVGSDQERSLAVDALVAAGAQEALYAGLSDRVEAIAAKSALALCRSNERTEFLQRIEPHVDPRRLDALLTLLAGYLH